MIFANCPILTSLEEGPSQGYLFFAKIVQDDLFDQIKASIDSDLMIQPYNNSKIPKGDYLIQDASLEREIIVREVDNSQLNITLLLKISW